MAKVNNATGVYATLGYNFTDPNNDVLELSADVQEHLNSTPAIISTWQAQDIANNSVNGYFQNPVANSTQIVWNSANSIIILTANVDNMNTVVYPVAITLSSTANSFIQHTNRLSGLIPFEGQDLVNPYYEMAMNYGKQVLYIVNQTDNITNSSPILGSFTSVLVNPQISDYANTANSYITLIANSITSTLDPETGFRSNTSNLTVSQINQITSDLSNTNVFLSSRQSNDITFYGNLQTTIDKYNITRQFTNMGETQTYLLENFIGSPKLISRINPS